jgi:hypothetical protein
MKHGRILAPFGVKGCLLYLQLRRALLEPGCNDAEILKTMSGAKKAIFPQSLVGRASWANNGHCPTAK